MSVTSGYHLKLVSVTGTATTAYNFIIHPTRYTGRLISPVTPRMGGGDVAYSHFNAWNVVSMDDFRAGVGWGDVDMGLAEAVGLTGEPGDALILAPEQTHTYGFNEEVIKMVAHHASASQYVYAAVNYNSNPNYGAVYYWNAGTWSSSKADFPSVPTDMESFVDGLYICFGAATSSSVAYKMDSASSWASCSWRADLLCRVNDSMWKAEGDEVYKSLDGTTWDAAVPVGLTGTNITAMAALEGDLYVAKPEGLYKVQDDTDVLEVIRFHSFDTDNGKGMIEWQNALYVPVGYALYRYAGGTVKDIAPQVQATDEFQSSSPWAALSADYWGRVTGMTGSPGVLYCQVQNDTDLMLYAYNKVAWHCWERNTATAGHEGKAIAHLKGATGDSGARRLYRNYGTDGQIAEVTKLPPFSEDLVESDEVTYRTSGYAQAPWFTADLPLTTKIWDSVEIVAERLSANQTIAVSYRTNSTASFTSIGTATAGEHNTFAIRSASSGMEASTRIQLRFDFAITDTTYDSPVMRAWSLNHLPRPSPRSQGLTYAIRTGNAVKGPDGNESDIDAATTRTNLMTLADHTGHIYCEDVFGFAGWVQIVNVIPTVEHVSKPAGEPSSNDMSVIYMLQVAEIDPGNKGTYPGAATA